MLENILLFLLIILVLCVLVGGFVLYQKIKYHYNRLKDLEQTVISEVSRTKKDMESLVSTVLGEETNQSTNRRDVTEAPKE